MKRAASGRAKEILSAAGIGSELLDGRHHACPKCGGHDRFRFTDEDGTGSLICTGGGMSCAKCGDIIASVMWWREETFQEAIKFVAEFLGIAEQEKPKKRKRKTLDEIFVPGVPWDESSLAMFCGHNAGISQVGIDRARATVGKLYGDVCVGIPAIGTDLAGLVNYVCMGLFRKRLAVFTKGEKHEYRKKTATNGSGLLGGESLDFIKANAVEVVWKVEGPTSMMALMSVIPEAMWGKHVVVSNVHGADEKPKWMAEVLAKCPVTYIVPDIDVPGSQSAIRWAAAISQEGGKSKIVQLPYEHVEGQSPRDLRDFVIEFGDASFGLLLSRAQESAEQKPQVIQVNTNADIPQKEAYVLEMLEIDVLFEDDRERVHIYSRSSGKTSIVSQVDRLTYERMIQICGMPAKVWIAPKADEAGPDQFTIGQVKRSICLAAAGRRMGDEDHGVSGPGIYAVTMHDGTPSGRVACCNRSVVSVMDENILWTVGTSPRVDGMLFDLGRFKWFDHEEMATLIEHARNPEWCDNVWKQLAAILGRWTWGRQETDPLLVAGLIGATFCQQTFRWRPQVSIRGKTNAGKTALLQFLFGSAEAGVQGVFGKLAFSVAESSSAGVRQSIGRTSYAIAIDEWDSQKAHHRRDILKLLRTAGPGSQIALGSTSHRSVKFGLRHICWISGIHCGLEDEADANRFLEFELLFAAEERRKAWVRPSQEEIDDLRGKLTAIAIVHCLRASEMAERICKSVKSPVNERIIRSLCVPSSLVAASLGKGDSDAVSLVERFCGPLVIEDEGPVSTEIDLLHRIFSLPIIVSQTHNPVSEVLHQYPSVQGSQEALVDQAASQLGLRVYYHRGKFKYLAIHTKRLANKFEEYGPKDLTQILKRLPGAFSHYVFLCSASTYCVLIPWELIESEIFAEKEDNDTTSLQ